MGLPTQGQLDKFDKAFGAVMLPFIFDSQALVFRVLDGPGMTWLAPLAEAQGFILLRNWDYGFRNVTNSVRPIQTPGDIKGLKLRTPPELQIQASMEALGASVQAIAFPELYLALAQKVVDGEENPIAVIYFNKFYETQKYLALTRHIYNNMIHTVGVNTWKKLTPEQQTIFREESVAAGDLMRKLTADGEEDQIKKLKSRGHAGHQARSCAVPGADGAGLPADRRLCRRGQCREVPRDGGGGTRRVRVCGLASRAREKGAARQARPTSLRRERGRFDDLVLLMLDVAGFRALLAIRSPVGIGFERGAPLFPVGLALEAPEEHHLVERSNLSGENPHRRAEMPDMDGIAVALIELQPGVEAPRRHRISSQIDDHRILPRNIGSNTYGLEPAAPGRNRPLCHSGESRNPGGDSIHELHALRRAARCERADEMGSVWHFYFRQRLGVEDRILRHKIIEVEDVGRDRVDLVGGQ